jgi:hypothetical protein
MPLSWVKRKFHAPKNPPVHDLGEESIIDVPSLEELKQEREQHKKESEDKK